MQKIPVYLREKLQKIVSEADTGIPIVNVDACGDGTATAVPHGACDEENVQDVESLLIFYAAEYLAIFDDLVDTGLIEEEGE